MLLPHYVLMDSAIENILE
jgi:hypothetical protein